VRQFFFNELELLYGVGCVCTGTLILRI